MRTKATSCQVLSARSMPGMTIQYIRNLNPELLIDVQSLLVEEDARDSSFERVLDNGNGFEAVAFGEAFGEGRELVCVKDEFLELFQVAEFGRNGAQIVAR